MKPNPLRTMTDLEPGDHICCLYKTEEEHQAVLTLFLRQGLERGEKVLYIVDVHTAETILGYLRYDGLDVEPYLVRGQLVILTRDEAYVREVVFDPEGMLALLRAETEWALAEGYPALRVIGEMTWALRGLPGSERLIECEAKLNEFLPGSKCLAICQYDQRRFDPEVLLNVLRTHPVAVIGTQIYDNFHYMPPAELLGHDLPAAQLRHWVQNLAERERAEQQLAYMATHDPLTGLPNRMLFTDRLTLALARANRNHQRLATMLLDLDHFKDVNDTLGHSVGDQLLQAVGGRLTGLLRESDTVARMGGDEFMLILPEIDRVEDAAKVAQKILEAVRRLFVFDGHALRITTSIGIAIYPYDGEDADTLMKNADIAMYRAKEQGRDNYQCYTPAMKAKALK